MAGIVFRVVLFFFFASIWTQAALAGEFTIFGPQTFTREAGKPAAFTVDIPSPVSGPGFTLKARNGDGNGGGRVSSAVVALNGSAVAGAADLNQQVGSIERSVVLNPTNQLSIQLNSQPGSRLTVTIIGIDNAPPQVAIQQPPHGTTTEAAAVAVSGTVIDETLVAVTINGIPATVTRQMFQAAGIPLQFGENTIRASATDLGGNTASHAITIIRKDTTPPQLTITDPLDGSTTELEKITVSGTVIDSSPVSVTVNGISAAVNGQAFSAGEIPLGVGANTITVVATDSWDNSTTATITVTRKSLAPPVAPQPEGSFGAQYEDLIPANATKTSYDPKRFALITGEVKNLQNEPIPDVTVSVNAKSCVQCHGLEYGSVKTDANGPAVQAKLNYPTGVAVDAAGNLYIADMYDHRIRKVDTSGIITTVAGNGSSGNGGDGGPAAQAKLNYPSGVAVDAAGNLYISELYNHRVRKVNAAGIITTLAGSGGIGVWGGGYGGDGGPAVQSLLRFPSDVTVDATGNLYIADAGNYRIRKVDSSGIITTVAGSGSIGYSGDGGQAVQAMLDYPSGVAVDAAGNLYIADQFNKRVRKVAPISAFVKDGIAAGDIYFTEENGLGHILSEIGQHKKTIDLDTGVALRTFGYDANSNLTTITDQFGKITIINRDTNGLPTAIVSPDGLMTRLTIDANNHLTAVTYPDSSFYTFEYTLDGLMTAEIDPNGNRFEHVFDFRGRLTDVTDPELGHWKYTRTSFPNGDIQVNKTTARATSPPTWITPTPPAPPPPPLLAPAVA